MFKEAFVEYAALYGLHLSPIQAESLLEHMAMVLEYNQRLNLTSISDETEFIDKHIIDSLLCELHEERHSLRVLDVGTGGGFPGLPLAIKYPEHHFVLMDSTRKKLRAVQDISDRLGLTNVSFLEGRAETLGRQDDYREMFDVVVSRGVASYPVLMELCTPFLKIGGHFFSWKGPHYEAEVSVSEHALKILNMKIVHIMSGILQKTNSFRVIINAEKIGRTSFHYPRNYSAIKKNPL